MLRLIKCLLAITSVLLACWGGALPAAAQARTTIIEETDYIFYEIQKSEGWYRVSKKFNVSQDELKAANPEKGDALRLGDVLRIPVKKQPAAAEKAGDYIVHVLAPKETLYGISRKYGVTIEQLVELNPETARRMAIGSKLLIPQKGAPAVNKMPAPSQPAPPAPVQAAPMQSAQPELHIAVVNDETVAPSELPIRIAFLLPFMLDALTQDPSIDKFIEFYEGALLAVREAKKFGMNIEVYAYDTEKNDLKIQLILQRPEMKLMDAIIGPAYAGQVEYVSNYAFENRICTFIPFTSRVPALQINPYLYQFNTMPEFEAAALADLIQGLLGKKNVVMVKTEYDDTEQTRYLRKNLKDKNLRLREIDITTAGADSLLLSLQKERGNLVLFNNDHFQCVQPYFAAMDKPEAQLYDIEMVGAYAWENHQEQIRRPFYYASLFVSDARWKRREYMQTYKGYYGHELSTMMPRYDMLGYDLTYMVLDALNRYGAAALQTEMSNYQYDGLQSAINFIRPNPMGGSVNRSLTVLKRTNGRVTPAM